MRRWKVKVRRWKVKVGRWNVEVKRWKVKGWKVKVKIWKAKVKRWKLKKWKVKGGKCEGLPTQLAGKNKNFFSFCVLESFVVVSSDIRDYFTSGWFIFVVTQS